MKQPIRALLLADDCNPEWPSLPVVGFKCACAIAEHVDVTVATHVRNRPNVEKVGMGRARVEYLDTEYVAKPLYKLNTWLRGGTDVGWTTNIALNYPSYLAFEWEAWRRFGPALKNHQFDIVHRITPMSPTLPSPMARFSPVPFVLGPLNGGLRWPKGYDTERSREKEWLVKLREAYRLLPFYRSTYVRSAAVLAGFQHTIDDLPEYARSRALNFPEVGVDPKLFSQSGERSVPTGKIKFLFCGRLVPYKLPTIPIECFAQSPLLRQHELLIVGEGPERAAMQERIDAAGLGDTVKMLGWKKQAEVGALMRESDVFVFPSIRELGAGVIAEAMASGLCSVAVDYGGPGDLLADGRGIKVPLGTREELVARFTAALEGIAKDPARAHAMGQAAREFTMRELTWDAKARRTVEIYRWVLGERPDAPQDWSRDSSSSSSSPLAA
jgi:glycosyltransferase involved in cell wall biosynthesis